jgi:exonuclease VII large subunit
LRQIQGDVVRVQNLFNSKIDDILRENRRQVERVKDDIVVKITTYESEISGFRKVLDQLNPEKVLQRGYALIRGEQKVGSVVNITTAESEIEAKIEKIIQRS